MRRYGLIMVVLLVGWVWCLGGAPLEAANKKPASTKPPAVGKSTAKTKTVLAQWWRNKKNRDMLGLTKDQVGALDEVIKDMALKRRSFNQRVKMAQEELDRIMSRGELDSDKLKEVTDEMVEARAGLIRNRVEAGVSIRGILTPAQLEKILKKDAKAFEFERPLVGGRTTVKPKKSAQKKQ